MKRKIGVLLSALLFVGAFGAPSAFGAQEIPVTVDGELLQTDTPAQLIDGNTMVPLRAICDALGAEVDWNASEQKITISDGTTVHTLVVGSRTVTTTQDGKTENQLIAAAPVVIDGRTLVPLRYVGENLDAEVVWNASAKTVTIRTQDDIDKPIAQMETITLKTPWRTITTGMSVDELIAERGKPDRIDKSIGGLDWYVYNRDYEEFMMVAIDKDTVCGFYTNAKEFSVNDKIVAGETTYLTNLPDITVYLDKYANNAVHAVLVFPDEYRSQASTAYETSTEYLAVQAKENFDCVNTFRFNHGLAPLKWDDLVAEAARLHAEDMAEQNYFSHTGLDGSQPHERYYNIGGTSYGAYGENISAGRSTGIANFDGWVNSEGHRNNMLHTSYTTMGVGAAYNSDSDYGYYFVQNFKG